MKKILLQLLFISVISIIVSLLTIYIYTNTKKNNCPADSICGNANKCSLFDEIKPDAEQEKKLKSLEENYLHIRSGCRKKISDAKKNLAEVLYNDSAETSLIFFKLKELNLSQSEYNECAVKHILNLKSVLKPAQQKKFCGIICGELEK